MTEQQVRERLWRAFERWMVDQGNTLSVDSQGQPDYYEQDVERFCGAGERAKVDD